MLLNARSLALVETAPAPRGGAADRRSPRRGRRPVPRLRDRRPGAGSPPAWRLARDLPGRPGRRDDRPRARSAAARARVVQVVTDHPVAACLASQYAGWAITEGKFFAMGSGPMRAAAGKEAIFDKIGHREDAADGVVGVLEGRKTPPPGVVAKIAAACRRRARGA